MVNEYMFKMFLGDNIADDSVTRETVYGTKYYTKLNTDKTAWEEIAKAAVEYGYKSVLIELADGVKYKTHPEIAIEGAWEVEELKEELQKLRNMGLTVYPKLNFSTAHDAWLGLYSRMVSTDEYYALARDLIHEVIDIFDKPEMFHFGLEDEGHHAQVRYDYVCFRQHDLYWHDINFLIKAVEKNGARPWLWADYIWHVPENEKDFVENMSHDALLSNWYYGDWEEDYFDEARRGYVALEKHGFEQVPTGGNCDKTREYTEENMVLTVDRCTKIIAPERLKGFMMTPWEMTTEIMLPRHEAAVDRLAEAHDYYYKRG